MTGEEVHLPFTMKGIVVLLALLSLSTAVIFNDTCDLVGSFNEYYAGVSVDLEFGNSLTVTVPNGLQVPNNTVIMIIFIAFTCM